MMTTHPESTAPSSGLAGLSGPTARPAYVPGHGGNAPELRILLVEDDEDDVLLIKELIRESLRGQRVGIAHARSCAEALRLTDAEPYQVYLLDFRLGKETGLELLHQLRARGLAAPLIFLTGNGDQEVAVEAMKAGATDYLLKSKLTAELLGKSLRYALDLQQKEDRLRQAMSRNSQLVAAMTNLKVGVVITDPHRPGNPAIFVNPAFCEMTGYTAQEALGRGTEFLRGPETDAAAADQMAQAIADRRPYTGTVLHYRKDGTSFWDELTVNPSFDDRGRLLNFVGLHTNVTERRRLEEQLRHAQKMEAVGRLAGGLAHDFNNLLTAIKGYGELLQARLGEGSELRRDVEEINRAADRAASLIRQLLTFSRRHVTQPRIVDLGEVIRDMAGMLRRLLGEDVELVTALSGSPTPVKADLAQLQQAVLNLAVNARDAMPRGGRLLIETASVELDEGYARGPLDASPGPYVRLTVTDNGVGMDGTTLSRLFEPFFTTKPPEQGSGLGLATVYGIVKQSGGHIRVNSEPGAGATFRIYLPRAGEIAAQAIQPVAQPTLADQTSETILLVEDQDMVRSLLRRILKSEGYNVLEARHGGEALAICGRYDGPVHLLVTDVVMPQMSGCELAEKLAPMRPDMRILFVSGYTSNEILNQGTLSAGAQFMQKPFTPEELVQKVREVLATAAVRA